MNIKSQTEEEKKKNEAKEQKVGKVVGLSHSVENH